MIDLPLRDPAPARDPADEGGRLYPGVDRGEGAPALLETDRGARSSGSAMLAVGMLAIGLLAGFGGGFLVGQRMATPVPPFAEAQAPPPVERVEPPMPPPPAPAAPVGTALETTPPAAPALVVEEPVAAVPEAPAPKPAAKPAAEPAPKPAAPPAPAAGALVFESRPAGATIYLDDVRVGVTPFTMKNVRPGAYRVRMELFGRDTWTASVNVVAGEQRFVGGSFE